jgi:hypothetical protein
MGGSLAVVGIANPDWLVDVRVGRIWQKYGRISQVTRLSTVTKRLYYLPYLYI